MAVDLHQHLVPEPLVAELRRRSAPPRVVTGGRGLRLELAGEPPTAFDPADHDPEARAAEPEGGGLDRIVASLSPALGMGALPAEEREPLLAAYNEGILE